MNIVCSDGLGKPVHLCSITRVISACLHEEEKCKISSPSVHVCQKKYIFQDKIQQIHMSRPK